MLVYLSIAMHIMYFSSPLLICSTRQRMSTTTMCAFSSIEAQHNYKHWACACSPRYNEALVDDLLRVVLALSTKRTVVVIANELRSVRPVKPVVLLATFTFYVPIHCLVVMSTVDSRMVCMYRSIGITARTYIWDAAATVCIKESPASSIPAYVFEYMCFCMYAPNELVHLGVWWVRRKRCMSASGLSSSAISRSSVCRGVRWTPCISTRPLTYCYCAGAVCRSKASCVKLCPNAACLCPRHLLKVAHF